MIYRTYAEIERKVRLDLDLQEETFITSEELLGYANEAINEAEAEIHTIYEDYFLTFGYVPLVNGTELYDLPSAIYANKIRAIIYENGSNTVYTIDRLREPGKFELERLANQNQGTDWYQYMLINNAAATISASPQMLLIPTPREDLTPGIKVWYLRNANRMIDDTSVCDIPEFVEFVIQYIKVRCYEKEGHPNIQFARVDMERHRTFMRDTLSNRVPDDDTKIPLDLSTYYESS